MEDKELYKIAQVAIPLSECPRTRQKEIWRREKLVNKIKAYVAEQLEKQFNAKDIETEIAETVTDFNILHDVIEKYVEGKDRQDNLYVEILNSVGAMFNAKEAV